MTRNVGGLDHTLRIVAGIALLGFAVLSSSSWWWVGLIGIVPLGTALVRWCPLYTVLGVSTCPTQAKRAG